MKNNEKQIQCAICHVSYSGKDLPGLVCSKCARECYRTIRDLEEEIEIEIESMNLPKEIDWKWFA